MPAPDKWLKTVPKQDCPKYNAIFIYNKDSKSNSLPPPTQPSNSGIAQVPTLPIEIWDKIFTHLPTIRSCLNCLLVCTHWHYKIRNFEEIWKNWFSVKFGNSKQKCCFAENFLAILAEQELRKGEEDSDGDIDFSGLFG